VLRVWTFWAEEVGPTIARQATPLDFRNGRLTVRVVGATWMQELRFLEEDIRARLNRRLGANLIRDIYFVAGSPEPSPRKPPQRKREKAASKPPAVKIPPLTDPRLTEIFERLVRVHAAKIRRDGE
jgi:predicted nucleic acid-binding Zn ribbon protein